jgi:hypothetical protein
MVGMSEQPVTKSQPVRKSTSQPVARPNLRKRLQADRNGVLIAAGVMAGVGWVLIYRLITTSAPLAFPRWLFFILLYIAITGTVLPLLWYLNQRFSRNMPITGGILLRQGMWCGLFSVTASWLQMTRALTPANGFFLALSIAVIEIFLRWRERARYYAERSSRDVVQ